jgi:uncharacterized protein
MVSLTKEVKDEFSATKLFPIATASKAGEPNVTPHGFVMLIDDETVYRRHVHEKTPSRT